MAGRIGRDIFDTRFSSSRVARLSGIVVCTVWVGRRVSSCPCRRQTSARFSVCTERLRFAQLAGFVHSGNDGEYRYRPNNASAVMLHHAAPARMAPVEILLLPPPSLLNKNQRARALLLRLRGRTVFPSVVGWRSDYRRKRRYRLPRTSRICIAMPSSPPMPVRRMAVFKLLPHARRRAFGS